jgi:hypothetical protein
MPSPDPNKEVVMNFPEAMQAIIEGDKVTRKEWDNHNIYIFLDGQYLCIMQNNGTKNTLTVTDGDMLGTDWVRVRHN